MQHGREGIQINNRKGHWVQLKKPNGDNPALNPALSFFSQSHHSPVSRILHPLLHQSFCLPSSFFSPLPRSSKGEETTKRQNIIARKGINTHNERRVKVPLLRFSYVGERNCAMLCACSKGAYFWVCVRVFGRQRERRED